MSHELTIRDDNALDVSALKSDIGALSYERILPDRTTELEVQTGLDGDDDTYGCYQFADTAPKADIVADLEALLPDTATVEYRHTWAEYDDTLIDDPAYYPSHWSDGLRAPPTANNGGKTMSVSADYLHGGVEYSDSKDFEFTVPTEYGRTDVIVADADGLHHIEGVEHANPAKSEAEWTLPDYSGVLIARVPMKNHLQRIPNGLFTVSDFKQ